MDTERTYEIPSETTLLGMSNLDQSIDDGLEEVLRAGDVCAAHSAWDFYGTVWFYDGMFYEQIQCYGVVRAVLMAESLEELMKKANDAYGWK